MKVVLLGFKEVDFVDKETNKKIEGTKVFLGYDDPDVFGLNIDSCWVSKKNNDYICLDLIGSLGKKIDVQMNFKGKVVCLSDLEDKEVA